MAKLRPFLAISSEIQADFSALQTAWRRGQSGANHSHANSLLTGKNTGNLHIFAQQNRTQINASYRFWAEKPLIRI
jgi:hypothetical protein